MVRIDWWRGFVSVNWRANAREGIFFFKTFATCVPTGINERISNTYENERYGHHYAGRFYRRDPDDRRAYPPGLSGSWRLKETKDISLTMLVLYAAGIFLWLVAGPGQTLFPSSRQTAFRSF